MNAAAGTSQEARVAVMGDLHLSREIMQEFFCPAREDIQRALGGSNRGGYVVQVGDLGAYEADPGSTACFEVAKEFLDGFEGSRVRLVTGNHDLEGSEFNTGNAELDDATNLGVWTQIFGQKHYWAENVGDKWLLLGLSTTRFRSNSNSCHEVFIDEEQRTWFERQLDENARMESPRKVAVFTHAPPAGCGLRVLHSVHVKNRCSWLNHSDESVRWFMELLSRRGDNVALWMSGHFHMSHDYVDSISVVGGTTFVQCGVIGPCNRDGNRQSRLLDLREDGFRVSTIDHNERAVRVDMEHSFDAPGRPTPLFGNKQCFLSYPIRNQGAGVDLDERTRYLVSEGADDQSPMLMRAMDSCSILPSKAERGEGGIWLSTGVSELHVQDKTIVEYDLDLMAPIGLVHNQLSGRRVRLVDSMGEEIEDTGGGGGARAVALEVLDSDGVVCERIQRNADKFFYRVFQQNKWKMKIMEQKRQLSGVK